MVRILTGGAANARVLDMPSDADLRRLRKIVFAQYPSLDPSRDGGPSHDPNSYEREFRGAFCAVGQMGRLPGPETRNAKHLCWWASYATDILGDFGQQIEVNGRTFAVACLAWGDVPHTIGPRFPLDVTLGLTYQHAGTPSGDGWRHVLSTGRLRPASAVQAGRGYRPGVQRIDASSEQLRGPGLVNSAIW